MLSSIKHANKSQVLSGRFSNYFVNLFLRIPKSQYCDPACTNAGALCSIDKLRLPLHNKSTETYSNRQSLRASCFCLHFPFSRWSCTPLLLPAQDVRRLFVHARDFGGMDDFQIHPRGGESVQFAVKCSLVPDKENFGSGLAGGLNRSGDDHGRTKIASHGVDGDNGLIAAHRRSSARRPDDRGRCRSWGRQRGEPWGLRRCSTQRWGWPRDRGTGAFPSWNETSYFAVRP